MRNYILYAIPLLMLVTCTINRPCNPSWFFDTQKQEPDTNHNNNQVMSPEQKRALVIAMEQEHPHSGCQNREATMQIFSQYAAMQQATAHPE